jgi:hypothetical protein
MNIDTQSFQPSESTKHLLDDCSTSSRRRGPEMNSEVYEAEDVGRLKEVLQSLETRKIIVRAAGFVFLDTRWNFGTATPSNSQDFHNAELTHTATESRSRSAHNIQKARGKRKRNRFTVPSFIIIFLRFNPLPNFSFFGTVILSGPILLKGPFFHTTGKTYPQNSMKVFSQISVNNIIHNSARNSVSPKIAAVNGWGQYQPTPTTLTEFLSGYYYLGVPCKGFYCENRNIKGRELQHTVERQEAPLGHPIAVMV